MFKYTKAIALAVAMLLALTGTALAAEFSADVIQKRMGQETKGKIWVKGGLSRMDMNMMGQDTTIINRPDKKMAYMVQHAAKMIMTVPMDDAMAASAEWNEKDLKKQAQIKNLGTEKVSGYLCDKKEITYKDAQMGKMTVWVARKLEMPIKTLSKTPYGDMETEYRNIKTGGVKKSVFDIPEGYQKMKMPQGMGGMKMQ